MSTFLYFVLLKKQKQKLKKQNKNKNHHRIGTVLTLLYTKYLLVMIHTCSTCNNKKYTIYIDFFFFFFFFVILNFYELAHKIQQ